MSDTKRIAAAVAVAVLWGLLGDVFAADLATRLKKDCKGTGWENRDVIAYVVPPMSSVKYLPDRIPSDGTVSDQLLMVAARGEFEPASFVLFAHKDLGDVTLKISGQEDGSMPASAFDIKVVKCWYQAGTAWHSYFADPTRRELVPELLLHDDDLVRVDHRTLDNYLRVDYPKGSEHVWVSYTHRSDPGQFNHVQEPVADSPTLKPVKLTAGEGKQFWVTVKVPETATPGTHSVAVQIAAHGKEIGTLSLHVRVLPFELPEPKTYYDLENPFYVSIYNHCGIADYMKQGASLEEASRKVLAEYRNMRDHGCQYPLVASWNKLYDQNTRAQFVRQLEILKQSGLKTKPVFGGVHILDHAVMIAEKESAWPAFTQRIDEAFEVVEEILGHHDVYPVAWDEPAVAWIISQRKAWKYVHQKGGHIMSTSKDRHFIHAPFNEDFSNYGGWVTPESARMWHAVGGKVATYASPHTGPENPDYIRRSHGMVLYKADLDGTCNYMYYEGGPNIWNEFNKDTYRCFNMVYPTQEDVVDTLAWEGFREAVDDIRYATKLRQLAYEAMETGDIDDRYAGKIALHWLAAVDQDTVDLTTMRLEMVQTIMTLHTRLQERGEK